ncbi:MAG: hypothetical protein IPM29_18085 [Planctomycetes bacterium]|nr:hypothetical protein [Planctomycetota bacterium]
MIGARGGDAAGRVVPGAAATSVFLTRDATNLVAGGTKGVMDVFGLRPG